MFALGAGSLGFQIGSESTDVIFIVMNGDGAHKLVQDSVKLGGDASIARTDRLAATARAPPICRCTLKSSVTRAPAGLLPASR